LKTNAKSKKQNLTKNGTQSFLLSYKKLILKIVEIKFSKDFEFRDSVNLKKLNGVRFYLTK